ncbi:MAG: RNA polymerase factor sigma-54 [Lentisphaeria bacterium]|nr:RNA polymerase factor sigma-54 [Lentisphaeria bacterium]
MPAEIQQRFSAEPSQEQQIGFHQIQSLEILALPATQLQTIVNQQLVENPVLESDYDAEDLTADTTAEDDEWLETILKVEESDRSICNLKTHTKVLDADEYHAIIEAAPYIISIHEQLTEQARFRTEDPDLRTVIEWLISTIDDHGYIKSHLADLAMISGFTSDLLQRGLAKLQSFEPAGVAARNLQERLLIQLERKGLADTLSYTIVKDYLDDLGANHIPFLIKSLQVSKDEVLHALKNIQGLQPRMDFTKQSGTGMTMEEIVVEDIGGEFVVHINNDYLPNIHISRAYRQLLIDQNQSDEVRNYVKDKVKAGLGFINSIVQRQLTIKHVSEVVVSMQKEYFIKGMESLRPMTMTEVAEIVGVHETTVSRTVSGKMLRSRQGVIPMKNLFSSGGVIKDGEQTSNKAIKLRIEALIQKEDPYHPLSDTKILEMLKLEGVKIARRTIAKYRDALGILPSNLRRKF